MSSFPRPWTSPEPSQSIRSKGKVPPHHGSCFLYDLALHQPCHVFAPVCRYLFWTEWGQYPRIERSRLDGSQRLVLVNASISWPNGISIDYQVRDLLMRTSLNLRIFRQNCVYQWKQQHASSSNTYCMTWASFRKCDLTVTCFISALSLQEGLLYWCDARTDRIERINLETGENRELVLANNNMDMFAVSVFEEYIYWSDR